MRGWGRAALGVLATALIAPAGAGAQQITPCDQQPETDYSRVTAKPRYGFRAQEVVELRSRVDGATIQIGLVRPQVPAGKRVPVVVDAGPYYHPMQTLDLRGCEPRLTENFVPQGYAVALVAVRGTSDSGGCMDLFGPDERSDLDQAIDWLGSQSWSSGRVGMVGLSYDGSTPWEAASLANRHLKTIVPVEGVTDPFELLFGRGTPDWRGPLVLNDIYYVESVAFYAPGRSPQHTVDVTACPDYATGSAASVESAQTGELDSFGYWTKRRYRDAVVRNWRRPVFLVQGFQDWNVNPGQALPLGQRLIARGVYVKQLLGQWGHGYPDTAPLEDSRGDWADMLLAWFDRWLKRDRNARIGPRAEVEDAAGRWRRAREWPPRGRAMQLWLTAEGGLAGSPAAATGAMTLAPDPVHLRNSGAVNIQGLPSQLETLCTAPLCAAFSTPPLPKQVRLAGSPSLRLRVTPTGPGGHVSAYLYAAGEQTAQRLGWGQADIRFPDGETRRPVAPGSPLDLRLDLEPLDAVAPAGSRLLLVLSQGAAYNRLPSAPSFPLALAVGGRQSSLALTRIHASPWSIFRPRRNTPTSGG